MKIDSIIVNHSRMPIPDKLYLKVQEQAGYQGENRFDEICEFLSTPKGLIRIELIYGEEGDLRFFLTAFGNNGSKCYTRFLNPYINHSNQKLVESEIIKWLLLPDNRVFMETGVFGDGYSPAELKPLHTTNEPTVTMPEHTKIKMENGDGSTTDMILVRFRMFED